MPKASLCIKIPKSEGQKTIALAGKLGLFDKSLEIQRDESNLRVPLLRQPNEDESEFLKQEVPDYQLVTSISPKSHQRRNALHRLSRPLPRICWRVCLKH